MATTRSRRRRLALAAATALAALAATAPTSTAAFPRVVHHALGNACRARPSYGWPVRPFDRPHPVRALFGDPRIPFNYRSPARSFHTGIDIVAADGTPVYTPVTGRVYLDPQDPQVMWVGQLRVHVFGFWHVEPSVAPGSLAVADRTVIGHVAAPWGHVHLTETVDGALVNPLRPGALGPYGDDVAPTVRELEAESGGRPVAIGGVSGRIDIVTEVADGLSLAVSAPWHDMPVMPALVRWRLLGPRGGAAPWTTAVDFRRTIPPAHRLTHTYAQWTRQNHPRHPGRYRVFLAHGLDTRALANGVYSVQVRAADTCGNRTTATFVLRIDNSGARVDLPLRAQP